MDRVQDSGSCGSGSIPDGASRFRARLTGVPSLSGDKARPAGVLRIERRGQEKGKKS